VSHIIKKEKVRVPGVGGEMCEELGEEKMGGELGAETGGETGGETDGVKINFIDLPLTRLCGESRALLQWQRL